MSYCAYVANLPLDNIHRHYHDNVYGVPLHDDNELFGRLILEINQAGLSWDTILKKEKNFRKAYSNFNIKKVAAYEEDDIARLLLDVGIIRNRLKVRAAVHNAQKIMQIQGEHGSFEEWLALHRQLGLPEWVNLFKKNFTFTGGEIVKEFLQSIGYIPYEHDADCPRHS